MYKDIVIKNVTALTAHPTRRKGIFEKKLLSPDESPHQNIVFIEAEQGAVVEYHLVKNSESLYILEGLFAVVLADDRKIMEPGSICYFAPELSHGLECLKGPGKFLVVFAPAAKEVSS